MQTQSSLYTAEDEYINSVADPQLQAELRQQNM